jgi:hypothetical protein
LIGRVGIKGFLVWEENSILTGVLSCARYQHHNRQIPPFTYDTFTETYFSEPGLLDVADRDDVVKIRVSARFLRSVFGPYVHRWECPSIRVTRNDE